MLLNTSNRHRSHENQLIRTDFFNTHRPYHSLRFKRTANFRMAAYPPGRVVCWQVDEMPTLRRCGLLSAVIELLLSSPPQMI